MESQRYIGLVVYIVVEVAVECRIDPLRRILHPVPIQSLKRFSVLQEIIVLLRNGDHARVIAFNEAVAVLDTARSVRQHLQNLRLKAGVQSVVGAVGMVPVEIPANPSIQFYVLRTAVIISLCELCGDLALLRPFHEQLSPISEMDSRQTINGLIMEYIHRAFAVCHTFLSLLSGCALWMFPVKYGTGCDIAVRVGSFCGIFPEQTDIIAVIVKRYIRRCLVIYGGNDLAAPHTRQDPFKFSAHCVGTKFHTHFVEMTEERHFRLFVEIQRNIHACLSFQREHPVRTDRSVPVYRHGDVAVGIDKHRYAVFVDDRDHLAVEGSEKFVKLRFRDHRPAVIAHILGKAHEVKMKTWEYGAEERDKPICIFAAHLLIEFRIVVEAVEVIFNSEQRARVPEKAFHGEKVERIAAVVGSV